MKMIKNLAIAGCSLLLLTQCASQDEVQNLQAQLRAVNKKVEDVKSKYRQPDAKKASQFCQ